MHLSQFSQFTVLFSIILNLSLFTKHKHVELHNCSSGVVELSHLDRVGNLGNLTSAILDRVHRDRVNATLPLVSQLCTSP